VTDHGGNNVVHVVGEEVDAGDDDGCQRCREQFFISYGADAVKGQVGV